MTSSLSVSLEDLLRNPPLPVDAHPQDTRPDERYDLFLNGGSEPVLVKAVDLEMLRDGRKPRLVAANLYAKRLVRLTQADMASLRHHGECTDEALLLELQETIKAFMAIRDSDAEPYLAALSYSSPLKRIDVHVLSPQVVDDAARVKRRLSTKVTDTDFDFPDQSELAQDDVTLIALWVNDRVSVEDGQLYVDRLKGDKVLARGVIESMAYARLAEKLVLDFIPKIYEEPVIDVSLTQTRNTSDLWKSCDIRVGENIYLDVKNRVQHGPGTPHVLVPKFKRVGVSHVAIAAVVTEDRRGSTEQVYLGHMLFERLREIDGVVGGLTGREHDVQYSFADGNWPAWAFDSSIGNLSHNHLFELAEIFAWWPETALAAAVACGRETEADLYSRLSDEHRRIVDLFAAVIGEVGYCKATIAMFAMSEFAATCARGGNPAEFIRFFREIVTLEEFGRYERQADSGSIFGSLWANLPTRQRLRRHSLDTTLPVSPGQKSRSDHPYEVAVELEESQSGGLHDPTNSIADLLDLLEKAGRAIKKHGIPFTHFTVRGTHILEARVGDEKPWTVYAYCGGRKRSGDRCGNSPLVIGEHRSCELCHRLICNKCQNCSPRCSGRRACW